MDGGAGEDLAAEHLAERGYRIVARNWRHGRWEIDLVAEAPPGRWPVLAIVEVKARRLGTAFDPRAQIREGQKRRIAGAARAFLIRHPEFVRHHVRFDAFFVLAAEEGTRIEHVEGAFRAS